MLACSAEDCVFDCGRYDAHHCAHDVGASLMCRWTGAACVPEDHQYTLLDREQDPERFEEALGQWAATLVPNPKQSC